VLGCSIIHFFCNLFEVVMVVRHRSSAGSFATYGY